MSRFHSPATGGLCAARDTRDTVANNDWAASIPDHMGMMFLSGKILPGVPAKQSLYYGVWIVDPQGINDFAIGDNPPPKVETGPG